MPHRSPCVIHLASSHHAFYYLTLAQEEGQKILLFVSFILFLRERKRERERERERTHWGEEERWGDAESEAGSRLRAVSAEPDGGLKLTNLRS